MALERWLYALRLRLRTLFRRNRVEDDLADEMQFHIDERTRELMAKGLGAREAREAALRTFGGVEQGKEECRDARGLGWLEDFAQDLRYGARMLARTPGFTAVAVLSLAIGIGANTAIFTLFDALLLKPLPVDRPDELRTTNLHMRVAGRVRKSNNAVSYRLYNRLKAESPVFSDLLAFSPLNDPEVRGGSRTLRASGGGLFVSPNYFSLLGVKPQIGRVFDSHADQAGTDHLIVLGDSFWQRELGGDPGVLGQSISINGVPFSVIGVAPAGFFGLTLGRVADLFLPLHATAIAQPGIVTLADQRNWMVQLVGRLKPGVNDPMATERLTTLRLTDEPAPRGTEVVLETVAIETGLTRVRERFARPLIILMVMVGLLLVIGCANVATMLLSRASARKTEIVIRSAIGAGQGRLLRQLATESALLVAAASLLGVVFASWATASLLALMQSMDTSLALDLSVDRRILLFTLIVSAITGAIAGLTPASHTVRVNAGAILRDRRETGAARGSSRLHRPFLVAQVALALALVAAAGLLTRTLYGLSTVDAGFDQERVVLATVDPAARGYKESALARYYQDAVERVRTAPGVEAVTLVQFSFLSGAATTGTLVVPGFTPASEDERWVQVYQVGPQFFSTLGMSIVEGRDFTEQDMTVDPRVIALNETMARRYFGQESPVGRTINDFGLRVIAVVRDARYNTLRDETVAAYFTPYAGVGRGRMTLAVRVASEGAATPALLRRIREVDPLVPSELTTLETVVNRSLGQERLLAAIAAFFGATALLLLSLGLYGVMAFWVSERTSEIGVRVALGARRSQVVWSVLHRPLTFVLLGTGIGILATIAGARFIANLLFGLAPQDPLTIAAAAVMLIAVAGIAGIVPVRRALRVDPVVALRCE